jgi:DNA repair photolyase
MSILTKGTLLRRDLALLSAASKSVPVSIGVSLALLDDDLCRQVEPGTPSARARLELIAAVRDAGLDCHVMASPILPMLSDSRRALDDLFRSLAGVGATSATAFALHLRGPTRGWYLAWLAQHHPALVGKYRRLYGRGAYVAPEYRTWLRDRVTPMLDGYGLSARPRSGPIETVRPNPVPPVPAPTLF